MKILRCMKCKVKNRTLYKLQKYLLGSEHTALFFHGPVLCFIFVTTKFRVISHLNFVNLNKPLWWEELLFNESLWEGRKGCYSKSLCESCSVTMDKTEHHQGASKYKTPSCEGKPSAGFKKPEPLSDNMYRTDNKQNSCSWLSNI